MINLTGLSVKSMENPLGDIEIKFTGLRDGEKLYEELLIGDDVSPTDHAMIMRAQESMIPWEELQPILMKLEDGLNRYDFEAIRGLLLAHVNGYQPQHEIKDPLFQV